MRLRKKGSGRYLEGRTIVLSKELNAPGIAWNRIRRVEDPKALRIHYFRTSCQHCENPACLAVCPVKAVYKGPFGEVLVDVKKYIGCQRCLAACPYGVPQFNTKGVTSYWPDKAPLVERVFEAHQERTPGKANTARSVRTSSRRAASPSASSIVRRGPCASWTSKTPGSARPGTRPKK